MGDLNEISIASITRGAMFTLGVQYNIKKMGSPRIRHVKNHASERSHDESKITQK